MESISPSKKGQDGRRAHDMRSFMCIIMLDTYVGAIVWLEKVRLQGAMGVPVALNTGCPTAALWRSSPPRITGAGGTVIQWVA